MISKLWIRKTLTMSLVTALVMTCSMVTLANSGKAAGELTVTGGNLSGETSFVTVNGERAESGRTVFSSSTISTPEGMAATLNFGKAGKVQIGSNTTFTLNTDGNMISGDLTSGTITVLSAAQSVGVRTLSGELIQLNAGETATATATTAPAQAKKGDTDWWVWALIFGGATAAIVYAATSGNDSNFGGSTQTTSPTR